MENGKGGGDVKMYAESCLLKRCYIERGLDQCKTPYVCELLPGQQTVAVLVGIIDMVGGVVAHAIQLHADQANGELAMIHSAVPSVPRGLP